MMYNTVGSIDVEVKMDEKKLRRLVNNIILLFPMYHKKLIKSGTECASVISPFNPKFRIMGMLVFYGSMQMSEISRKLCVTKPHMTALIDTLIKEKMVKRHHDDSDRRIIMITITSKGREYLAKCRDETKDIIKKNISELSGKDFERLVKASEDIITILSKIDKDDRIAKMMSKINKGRSK